MPPRPLATVFAEVPDPRRETRNELRTLADVPAIATCGGIAGAETWEDLAEYGPAQEAFLRPHLRLPNGIPSPDPFGRVFATLDPAAFATAFGRWMRAAGEGTGLIPVAIDGTSARSARATTATGHRPPATGRRHRGREVGGKRAQTTHYDRSRHRAQAEISGRGVRAHWGIRNGLHWALDVVYGEDDRRVRAGHAGANLGMIRGAAVAPARRAPREGERGGRAEEGRLGRRVHGGGAERAFRGIVRKPCPLLRL